MKTILRPNLIRLATIDSRAVAALAVAALSLLASCTASRPVSYAGPESAYAIAARPEPDAAQMQCWRCEGISWIRHDANHYTDHTCPFCSTVNTL